MSHLAVEYHLFCHTDHVGACHAACNNNNNSEVVSLQRCLQVALDLSR